MAKTDINTRDDIFLLVSTFYGKVREDATLGPIFNKAIVNWEEHLQLLTTFWESSLFMARKLEHKYRGNPLEAHIKVDVQNNHSISEKHFGIWLNLWLQTIDELFKGEVSENAKRRARKMATFLHMSMFQARDGSKIQ